MPGGPLGGVARVVGAEDDSVVVEQQARRNEGPGARSALVEADSAEQLVSSADRQDAEPPSRGFAEGVQVFGHAVDGALGRLRQQTVPLRERGLGKDLCVGRERQRPSLRRIFGRLQARTSRTQGRASSHAKVRSRAPIHESRNGARPDPAVARCRSAALEIPPEMKASPADLITGDGHDVLAEGVAPGHVADVDAAVRGKADVPPGPGVDLEDLVRARRGHRI